MIVQLKRVAHHPSNNYLNRVEATGTEADLDTFRRFAVFLASNATRMKFEADGLTTMVKVPGDRSSGKVRYIIEKTEPAM